MAAKAITAERTQKAILSMKESADALAQALSIDAAGFGNPVKGDGPYQEMARAEQTASLLKQIRDKVAPGPEKPEEPTADAPAPDADADAKPDDAEPDAEGEGGTEDEPTFGGHALSEFDGLTDEQALELEHVGEATLKKVRAAQKKRDRNK